MLGDCYSNGGLEKREIVICKWCLSKYTRAAGVGGKPIVVGVQSITTRHYDEQHILAVLKSVIAAIPTTTTTTTTEEAVAAAAVAAASSYSSLSIAQLRQSAAAAAEEEAAAAEASAAAANSIPNDFIFYKAVKLAYDTSRMIKTRYFKSDPSRIGPDNKFLWPLRYQAYKRFGV
jgi:hypothetical protein